MFRLFKLTSQIALVAGVIIPAGAQSELETPPTGNIFSPPPQERSAVPEFTNGQRGRGPRNRMGGDIPGWDQIKAIPSLTMQQRRELRDLLDKAREELRPLMQELKAARQKGGSKQSEPTVDTRVLPNAGPLGQEPDQSLDAGNHKPARPIREIRQQLSTRRQQIWEQIKLHLSSEQLHELELMRKGQLLPRNLSQSN